MLPTGVRHGAALHRRRRIVAAGTLIAIGLLWSVLWVRLAQLNSSGASFSSDVGAEIVPIHSGPSATVLPGEAHRVPVSKALLSHQYEPLVLPGEVRRLPNWSELLLEYNRSLRWRVACNATEPREVSHESGQLAFFGRFFDNPTHPRENAALLDDRGVFFTPELSSSPLWAHFVIPRAQYDAQHIADALTENRRRLGEVKEIISSSLRSGACRRGTTAKGTPSDLLYLLTSASNSPKQALESVVYHLLVGVDVVVILDTSSGRRWPTPPLSDYLEPFVSLGLVKLVSPDTIQNRSVTAAVSDSRSGVDSRHSDLSVFAAFVETTADAIVRRARHSEGEEPLLLVLRDVSEYLVLTHSAPKHSPATSCLRDQIDQVRREIDVMNRSVVIPRAVIGQDEHFDSSRTPFERMSFATGSTTELQHPFLVPTRKRKSGTQPHREACDEFKRFRDHRRSWLLADHGALFRASSLRKFFSTNTSDVCVVFDHRPRLSAKRHHFFPPLCEPDPDMRASTTSDDTEHHRPLGMRVVRMSCTSQSCVENLLEECFATLPISNGSQVPHATPSAMNYTEGAIRTVNFKRIPRYHKNVVDDLPRERSLANNGFLSLHDEMLSLLRFPQEDMARRRRVTLRDPDPPIYPELQKILRPYVRWGPGSRCRRQRNGLGLRSTDGDGFGGGNSDGLGEVLLENISNYNLAVGCIVLADEVPLQRLNRSVVERVLGANDELTTDLRGLSASTRSAMAPRRSETPNITFCALVRNRAKLTLEWVLYHRLFGVSRFLIFDDHSRDGLREALQPLVDAGLVSFLNVSLYLFYYRFQGQVAKGPQFAVYSACVDLERERARRELHAAPPWIGFLDPDEFVVLNVTNSTIGWDSHDLPDLVRQVVEAKTPAVVHDRLVGGLALQWRYMEPLPGDFFDNVGTQFERVGFHGGVPDKVQRIKVIVRSDLIRGMSSAHLVDLAEPAVTVFPSGEVARSGWYSGNSTKVQRGGFLAHFHVRSLVAWLQKFLDGFSSNSNMIWAFDANMYTGMWFSTVDARKNDAMRTVENYRELMALPTMRKRFRWLQVMLAGDAL